jgi:hypothetical protein
MNEKQVISAGRTYNFDKVYNTESKNHDIYEDIVHPNLTHFINGINLTIMAYGQTSSGKTYTMLNQDSKDTGIVYESLSTLFGLLNSIQRHALFISCFEIYNEHIYDMINNTGKVLQLRYKDKDAYVSNLVWKKVETSSEASKYIDSAIKHRSYAKTNMNEHSSRSHFLVCFKLHQYYDIVGEETQSLLYFVDLAGSEKHQNDSERVREASYINRSLSTLSQVINHIQSKQKHVPYRDSTLTQVIGHAIGGNSLTSVILNISCEHEYINETISTLQFGERLIGLPNDPRINKTNAKVDYNKIIDDLEKQISEYRVTIQILETENKALRRTQNEEPDISVFENIEEDTKSEDIPPLITRAVETSGLNEIRDKLNTVQTENKELETRNTELQNELNVLKDTNHNLSIELDGLSQSQPQIQPQPQQQEQKEQKVASIEDRNDDKDDIDETNLHAKVIATIMAVVIVLLGVLPLLLIKHVWLKFLPISLTLIACILVIWLVEDIYSV